MKKYTKAEMGSQATIEELKQHLLEMLIALDEFCSEHGLRYYLSGGTLLGAIRHKGFIPWDDDIDVNMPRPDCEKLMELSGGKIGRYILNPPNYSETYHAYHWKLYDDSILICKRKNKGFGKKVYPPFIDIFPIEGLPASDAGNRAHYRKIGIWKSLANALWGDKWFHGSTTGRKILNAMGRPLAKLLGKRRLFKHVISTARSIPFDESDYIGVMMTNVHKTEERVVKAEYIPRIDVEFEGHTFPGPAGYDTYLTQLYGSDYMELPPEEKRVSHHALVPFHRLSKKAVHKKELKRRQALKAKKNRKNAGTKIAICGLIKSENLGELFIARSLEYLIKTECRNRGLDEKLRFVEVDLLGRRDKIKALTGSIDKRIQNYYGYSKKGVFTEYIFIGLKRFAARRKSQGLKNLIHRFRHFIWCHGRNYRKRLYKYYSKKIKDCAFIVVDGAGLLEYSYNEYQEPLNLLSEYAEEKGLDIVYNAIGRAGAFSEKDFGSTILKKALQSERVKYVSARDSVETVQICAGPKHKVKLLADAAFWMKETYNLPEVEERKKVGIGIIRGNSLQGYGVDFGTDDWVKLFAGIANELEARGFEYEFFTNGLPGDIKLGKKILKYMGLPDDKMVKRPTKDKQLYKTISQYQGLITCRMHSCIAAFTLAIPTVILSWNDKVVKLMETTGYPERAITLENFDPKLIVERFVTALKEGIGQDRIDDMKARALESVDDYIDLIIDAVNKHAEERKAAKAARIAAKAREKGLSEEEIEELLAKLDSPGSGEADVIQELGIDILEEEQDIDTEEGPEESEEEEDSEDAGLEDDSDDDDDTEDDSDEDDDSEDEDSEEDDDSEDDDDPDDDLEDEDDSDEDEDSEDEDDTDIEIDRR